MLENRRKRNSIVTMIGVQKESYSMSCQLIPFPWCFLVSRCRTVYTDSTVCVREIDHSRHNEIEQKKNKRKQIAFGGSPCFEIEQKKKSRIRGKKNMLMME